MEICPFPQSILPIQHSDNSRISDVSHSINDYFSADVKDYHLLLERINYIESLPDNWNGNGAEVFSADIRAPLKIQNKS
jgi:hypothetical protein